MVLQMPESRDAKNRLVEIELLGRNIQRMTKVYEGEWISFGNDQIHALGLADLIRVDSVKRNGHKIEVVLSVTPDPHS